MADQVLLRCQGCGAQLSGGARKREVTCPYCGMVNVFKKQVEAAGGLICPNCGATNHDEAEYCADCGQGLYLTCPQCGMRNKSDVSHCTKCGLRLGEEIKWRHLYFDYLSEAKRIRKIFQRRFNPWFLSLIPAIFAIIMNISYPDDFGLMVGITFLFSIPAIILLPIGKKSAKKKAQKEVESINFTKPGFSEFYNLYFRKHYWADEMVQGEKREYFLSIINKIG